MDIETSASILAQKVKHLIITTSGHTTQNASLYEFYQALCLALREEAMVNWTASRETVEATKCRVAYLLSMEYLPGRYLNNNLSNMGVQPLIRAVAKKLGHNLEDLLRCEADPGLGNGGLGRLASCFLDSLATLHYPARAYGLRYQYGIFDQEIWEGVQLERPDCWLRNANPWECRRDHLALSVRFRGRPVIAKNETGEEIELLEDFEEIRALPYDTPIIGYSAHSDYSVLTLRLWSTKESPRNFQLQRYNAGFLEQAAENTSLTDVLYPNDNNEMGKRVRLKQEFLLVSASLQDILRKHLKVFKDISSFGDKVRIQINDTHPALVVAELMHSLTKNYNYKWEDAWETCQAVCSYTNHTVLREGLEEWNENRVRELLPRQYKIIQRLNLQLCNEVRNRFPGDEARVRRMSCFEGGQIKMAHLAIYGSHKVNGVAELHTEILKTKLFKDFYELSPEKFCNVTNGITQRRWLLLANPRLAKWITERIGEKWITDLTELKKLTRFASDATSQKAFLHIKQENKKDLIRYLETENPLHGSRGEKLPFDRPLHSSALFDVQVKRIHEYKRQLLSALHLIMLYYELKDNPGALKIERLSLFGGKAAPGYVRAKQILLLLSAIGRTFAKDPAIRSKLHLVWVENYNVSKAELIIPAADLSEQISMAGREASGTGNMKLSLNGALTIGTEDGANIEMRKAVGDAWWPLSFGKSAAENELSYKPKAVYESDPAIRRAVDALKEGPFAQTAQETSSFAQIYQSLLESDTYRVLQDLRSYYEAQRKAEALFLQPSLWAETAIHNIAAMGYFSTDRAIQAYAETIWEITPCPPRKEILAKVRDEYSEHDRCRLTPNS